MIAPGYHWRLSMSTARANISRTISHVAGDYKCTALTQFIRVLTKIPRLIVVNHSRWNGEAFSSGSSRVFTVDTVFCKSSVFFTRAAGTIRAGVTGYSKLGAPLYGLARPPCLPSRFAACFGLRPQIYAYLFSLYNTLFTNSIKVSTVNKCFSNLFWAVNSCYKGFCTFNGKFGVLITSIL